MTNDPASDDHATWSADGQRIAFTSRAGNEAALVVINADGSNALRHTLPHSVTHPRWSPAENKIAYSALSDGSANVWIVDADGGWPTLLLLAPGWDNHPAWSPDGAALAVVSDWFAYDFVYDVFMIDADGAHFKALTDGNIFDHVDYLWPSWSPTGAKIATTISHEYAIDRYIAFIAVMNPDGSDLRPLIAAAPWSKSSWSRDGTMIVFTSGTTEASNVSWVKADASAWGTIIANGKNPEWQR